MSSEEPAGTGDDKTGREANRPSQSYHGARSATPGFKRARACRPYKPQGVVPPPARYVVAGQDADGGRERHTSLCCLAHPAIHSRSS